MRKAGNAYQNSQGPLVIGAATGGFQTAGTINAQGLFINGVAVTAGTGAGGVSSLAGTANQIAVSAATGAVTLSLSQNTILPTPAAGIALTVTGVAGSQAAQYSASGSTNIASYTGAATTNRAAISIIQSGGNTAIIGLDGTQQILSGTTNGDLCIRNAQTIRMSANGFVASQFTLSTTGQLTIATSNTTDAITATAPTGTAPATVDAGEIFVIKNTSTAGGDLRLLTMGQVGANAFIRPVLGGAGPTAAGLQISTSGGGTTFASGGNVTINAPASGVALIAAGVSGQFVQTLNPSGAALSSGLSIVGTFSGAGTTQLLLLSDTANTNGANIQLTGNGANPNKFIRANAGVLQILNSAYSATLLALSDAGALTNTNTAGVTATFNSSGINAQVSVLAPSTFTATFAVAANGNAASAGVIVQQDTSSNAFIRNLGSGTFNLGVGATNYWTMSAAGNVTQIAPTSGVALSITGFAGSSALQINTTGVQVGSPTGGDKGAGTINVSSGFYVNNVLVGSSGVTSVTGTANQVTASPTTGAVVVSLPVNVIIPTPGSGVALAITGSNTSSAALTSTGVGAGEAATFTAGTGRAVTATSTGASSTVFATTNQSQYSVEAGNTFATGGAGIALSNSGSIFGSIESGKTNSVTATAGDMVLRGVANDIVIATGTTARVTVKSSGGVIVGAATDQGAGTLAALTQLYVGTVPVYRTNTFTGTFTGVSTGTTATVSYAISGTTATLSCQQVGTSNATTFTMTGLPALLQPASLLLQRIPITLTDNGSIVVGMAEIATASGTITFYRDVLATGNLSTTGFTASGNKGWNAGVITFSLI